MNKSDFKQRRKSAQYQRMQAENFASAPLTMRKKYLETKKQETLAALSEGECIEKRKWLIRSLRNRDVYHMDVTEREDFLNEYKQLWEYVSSSKETDHGTFVWAHSYEEGYGMRKPFDSQTFYYEIAWTRWNYKVPCGFTLHVWELRDEFSKGKWCDINGRCTAVLNVDWDTKADSLSVDPMLSCESYSFAPFSEQAEMIAKKWCVENGYELERRILAIPQIRWLIRKKWNLWFFNGKNGDFNDAQNFFNALWEIEESGLNM